VTILCVAGAADVVRMLMSPVAQAKGRTDYVFWWALLTFGTQGVAFAIGVRWGIVGVATAYAITTLVLWPLNVVHFGRRLVAMTLRQYGATLLPAVAGALALAGTWLVTDIGMQRAGASDLGALVVATVVGLGVYVTVVRFVFPNAYASALEVAELMRERSA
jgi:PST family polysaccharide transporter